MDKAAALMKFQGLLNQLVSDKIKKDRSSLPSETPEMDSELSAKGELLKKLSTGEEPMSDEGSVELPLPAPEGMEAELEIEPEVEEEVEETPELPPELVDMLAKILGQKQVKGTRDITDDIDMKKPKVVPMGGISMTEVKVIEPKKLKKK